MHVFKFDRINKLFRCENETAMNGLKSASSEFKVGFSELTIDVSVEPCILVINKFKALCPKARDSKPYPHLPHDYRTHLAND